MNDGYFPVLIRLVDSGEHMVVTTPEKIPSGRPFKVLETNIKVI